MSETFDDSLFARAQQNKDFGNTQLFGITLPNNLLSYVWNVLLLYDSFH